MLTLDDKTLVYIVSLPQWMLPLRAPAGKVECASRTVEDDGRERLWSGCEPKPVSADQILSTGAAQSPRAHEIASSIVRGSWVDKADGKIIHFLVVGSLCGALFIMFERLD